MKHLDRTSEWEHHSTNSQEYNSDNLSISSYIPQDSQHLLHKLYNNKCLNLHGGTIRYKFNESCKSPKILGLFHTELVCCDPWTDSLLNWSRISTDFTLWHPYWFSFIYNLTPVSLQIKANLCTFYGATWIDPIKCNFNSGYLWSALFGYEN